MARRALAALIAIGSVFALASPASAQRPETFDTLLASGEGQMIANPSYLSWTWEVCDTTFAGCAPFATGQIVTTDGAPANVAFRATSSAGTRQFSDIWLGRAMPLGKPLVSGTVRAGELVQPVSPPWQGGWAPDRDETQLAACQTPSGERCITLTRMNYIGPACPGNGAVLDPAFTGWYLRVAAARFSRDLVSPSIGYTTPYTRDAWLEAPARPAAVVGQIAPAPDRRPAPCGPPPLEDGTIAKTGSARVTCVLGCRATLSVARGKRRARASLRVVGELSAAAKPQKKKGRPKPGIDLRLAAKALEKLGSGKAKAVLRIDGERVAGRKVMLRSP